MDDDFVEQDNELEQQPRLFEQRPRRSSRIVGRGRQYLRVVAERDGRWWQSGRCQQCTALAFEVRQSPAGILVRSSPKSAGTGCWASGTSPQQLPVRAGQ